MEIVTEAQDIVSFPMFDGDACREFVRDLSDIREWPPSRVYTPGGLVLSETRKSCSIPLEKCPSVKRAFDAAVDALVKPVARLYWDYGVRGYAGAFIARYNVGDFVDTHLDNTPGGDEKRAISLLCYLNGDFKGGETVFPRQRRSISPAAGKAIMYPATFTHPHAANKVVSGTRYVIVAWLH